MILIEINGLDLMLIQTKRYICTDFPNHFYQIQFEQIVYIDLIETKEKIS